jgi:hypothetical protein
VTIDAPSDAREELQWIVRNRRLVFLHEPTVEQALAFLAGFDVARGYAVLREYQVWLVVKLRGGFNLHWFALTHKLAIGIGPNELIPENPEDSNVGTRILELTIEYLNDIETVQGRCDLYREYELLWKGKPSP